MDKSNKPLIDGSMVLLGEENSGRDEMNLAGNPFALLQSSSKTGATLIENEWDRTLPNGKIVKAVWRVNGDVTLGLPGPAEELVYLVLLQFTRESANEYGVWPQKVRFSQAELLRRLQWAHGGKSSKKAEDAFARLKGVTITARNAFWDAENKAPFKQVGFNLIDDYKIANEPSGVKPEGYIGNSEFTWSEVVYKSLQSGNVRSLALDFILSLDLPTSRRLFRYLDMMRGATTPPRREFAIGLAKLCERLGMTNYKYVSKTKEKLKPAIDELKKRNYLEDVRYQNSKDGTELVFFRFATAKRKSLPENDQGRVEVLYAQNEPNRKVVPNKEPAQTKLFDEPIQDVRLNALRCHVVFTELEAAEQSELLELARKDVSPIWHDRVGQPESPMSLGLWQLVATRYPKRCK